MVKKAKANLTNVEKDLRERSKQEKQFKQVEEAVEKQEKTELTGFAKEADELNLNENNVYAGLEKAFTGVRTDEDTTIDRTTGRTGISDDVDDAGRPTDKDPQRVKPSVDSRLGEVGLPISDDTGGEGQRGTALTNDAQNLLDTVEKGGMLPSINNNVKRILQENNVEITPQTTPEQAINLLKEKSKERLTATETSEVGAAITADNIKQSDVRFAPSEKPKLVDNRSKPDLTVTKTETVTGGRQEGRILDPRVRKRIFDKIKYKEPLKANILPTALKDIYGDALSKVKITRENTSYAGGHHNGGVVLQGRWPHAVPIAPNIVAHELGHASHSLLGNSINTDSAIQKELSVIENTLYPDLRNKILTADKQQKIDPLDVEFFNYLLSPEEIIAEFNAYRILQPEQANKIAPNLVDKLSSVESAKNLVVDRKTFPNGYGTIVISAPEYFDGDFTKLNAYMGRAAKRAADKGLTATEKSESFIFGAREGEVTKKALSTQDVEKLTKFLPLPREEIDARINNLYKTKPEDVEPNTPKEYLLKKISPMFASVDAREAQQRRFDEQDLISLKEKKSREKAEAKKKEIELAKKRTEDIKGASKFAKTLNLQERNARIELNKQFKDRFNKKADLVEKAQAKGFKPEKTTLVSEGKGDRTERDLDVEPITDPTTSKDKKLILNLLESKPKDKEALAAKMYFNKVGSTLQGLEQIVYDAKYQKERYRKEQKDKQKNPETLEGFITFLSDKGLGAKTYTSKQQRILRLQEFIEDKFAEGSGAEKARQAIKWMKTNLTDATNDYVTTRLSEETLKKTVADQFLGHSIMYLPSENISDLADTLSPNVRGLLAEGDLKNALTAMPLPKTIKNLGKKLAENIGDTKIKIVSSIPDNMVGLFDPKTNTIKISETEGMNSHVLLHEVVHAVTSATLAKKSHPMTKQLNALYNDVKGNMGTARGSENLDEFVSEAFSNPEFQAELASINPKGDPINALQRFINAVANFIKRMTGGKLKLKQTDALSEFSDHVEAIIAPAPKYRDANKLSMFSTKDGVSKYMKTWSNNIKDVYTGKGADPSLGQTAINSVYEMSRTARALSLQVLDTQSLGDVARSSGYQQTGILTHEDIENQRGDMDKADKVFTAVSEKISKWFGDNPNLIKHFDNLIYHPEYGATLYQVDPNKKESDYRDKNGIPKTIDGNNQVEAWKRGQQEWNKLGTRGKEVFNEMRAYYQKQYDKLEKVLYGEIDSTDMDKEAKDSLKNDVFKKLFAKNKLNVYFPLMRDGRYKLSYELKDKTGKDPYVVQMFQTKIQRDIELKRIKDNDIAVGEIKTSDTLDVDREMFNNAPSDSFISDVLNILDANLKGDPKARKAVTDDFISLYINTLPETSFARSLQPRKGNPGYNIDALEAFKTKGFDLGRQIARISNGSKLRARAAEIREIMKGGAKNAKIPKSITGKFAKGLEPTFEAVGNELLERIRFATAGADNKKLERFVKSANQTAFLFTIGTNPSSALVNLSQIPIVVFNYLGGQFGFTKSFKNLGKSYKLVQQSGRSLDSFYDYDNETGELTVRKDLDNRIDDKMLEKIKPLVKLGLQRGLLNRSFIADVLGINERGRKQQGSVMDKLTGASAIAFNAAERLNRQVTMLSSYNLVLEALETGKPFSSMYEGKVIFPKNMSEPQRQEFAAKEALYMTQQTNGGAVLETAPRVAQQGLGRVAMMYKTFGARMYYTMLKTAKIALDSDPSISKEDRKVAFKQLVGVTGTSFFLAGLQGIPIYGAVKVIANSYLALFGDEDDEDFDTLVRKQFGELGYKGVIAEFTGIDMADRIKMTGLLFQENKFNSDQSIEEEIFGHLGGPFVSVLKKLGRGVSDIADGEIQRGMESLLPTGVANFWKATFGRVAREGYLTRRGDPIYDDITGTELFFLAFGLPPTEYTFRQSKNRDIVKLGKKLAKKRSSLLKDLYLATENFDYERELQVLKEIDTYNNKVASKFPGAVIDSKTEKRSLETHRRTTANMYNGVNVSPIIRDSLLELDREYG